MYRRGSRADRRRGGRTQAIRIRNRPVPVTARRAIVVTIVLSAIGLALIMGSTGPGASPGSAGPNASSTSPVADRSLREGAVGTTRSAAGVDATPPLSDAGDLGEDCPAPTRRSIDRAREMRQGRLTLPPHPTVLMPANPTWAENPLRDVNWEFRYHSMRFIGDLVGAWRTTRDVWYIERAGYLVRDWMEDNPHSHPPSRFSWNDHSTAQRAIAIACLVQVLPEAAWARAALIKHAQVLASPSFYRRHGNHALNQNRALLTAGCLLGRRDWQRLAAKRLTELVVESVDDQGVTNEQAIYYELYNYEAYVAARDRLRSCGLPVPPELARIDAMPAFLAHATLPDQTYWMIGDTVRQRAERLEGTAADFAATGGASGRRPGAVFVTFDAGFAFGRSGWGEHRDFRDEAAYSLRYGPGQRFHGHLDHGSVTFCSHGKRLIDDSGMFTVNPNRWRVFATGRSAHNVVTVDGVTYDPSARARITRARSDATRDDLTLVDPGYDEIDLQRRILFSRRGRYLVIEDRITAPVDRTVRQLWHLAIGMQPIRSGTTVRTTGSAGNVRIIQLAAAPTVSIIAGRQRPVQGWISERMNRRVRAPVVEATQRGRSIRYLTLIVPTADAAVSVKLTEVELTTDGWSFVVDIGGARERVRATATSSSIEPRD
jgi:hypothetical protein